MILPGLDNISGGAGGIQPSSSASSGPAGAYGGNVSVGGFNVPAYPFGSSGGHVSMYIALAAAASLAFFLWKHRA